MAQMHLNRIDNGWRTAFQERTIGTMNDSRVREHINEIIVEEIEPYIPLGGNNARQEAVDPDPHPGYLRESVDYGPVLIRWTAPYARYQYWGQTYGPNYYRPIMRKANGAFDVNGPWWYRSPKGVGKKYPTGGQLEYHTQGTGPFWYRAMMNQKGRHVNQRISGYLIAEMRRRRR